MKTARRKHDSKVLSAPSSEGAHETLIAFFDSLTAIVITIFMYQGEIFGLARSILDACRESATTIESNVSAR